METVTSVLSVSNGCVGGGAKGRAQGGKGGGAKGRAQGGKGGGAKGRARGGPGKGEPAGAGVFEAGMVVFAHCLGCLAPRTNAFTINMLRPFSYIFFSLFLGASLLFPPISLAPGARAANTLLARAVHLA